MDHKIVQKDDNGDLILKQLQIDQTQIQNNNHNKNIYPSSQYVDNSIIDPNYQIPQNYQQQPPNNYNFHYQQPSIPQQIQPPQPINNSSSWFSGMGTFFNQNNKVQQNKDNKSSDIQFKDVSEIFQNDGLYTKHIFCSFESEHFNK